MRRRKKTWYAASVILYVQTKQGRQRSFPVFENVYLIAAHGPDEVRVRAEVLGRAEAGAAGVEWKGKPAEMVFGGVRKIVACAADPSAPGGPEVSRIYDGIEATYSSLTVRSRSALNALIHGKSAEVVYEA